ncbi:MAG: HD domain-containing phosphohydrolase [Solirubrobacteraceae bacterium]
MPRRIQLLLGLAGVGLLAQVLDALFGLGPSWLFQDVVYNAVELLAAALILERARAGRQDRLAWAILGVGVLLWTIGDLCWSFVLSDTTGTPSIADAFYIAFYPCAVVTVVLLARRHVSVRGWAMRLDGIIAALGLAALAATLLLGPALGVDAPFAEQATLLSYPVGDLLLIGVVGAMSVTGGRRTGVPWMVIGGAIAVTAMADSVYLMQATDGTYVEGSLLDSCWLLGSLGLGYAAWRPVAASNGPAVEDWRSRLVPMICGVAAVVVLTADHFAAAPGAGVILAALTLAAVLARLVLTARESDVLLSLTRQDATTDALTGLGNRRALLVDLDRACRADTPAMLAVFDLNGFKQYNDTFGHPAGDALLHRIGGRLRGATGGGTAYRLGGDEFCLVAETTAETAPALVARALSALNEQGEGFAIDSSHGYVLIPDEADEAGEAMRIADRRMYAQKHGRSREGSYIREALLRTVQEGHPELGRHQDDVARLARRTAEALGLDAEETDVVFRTAELHDIGKIAIPDEILNKTTPLTPEEWTFIHRHTIVGERILSAAPALAPIARAVRSSHERWDGGGYPDGLEGEAIPLAARIVAVCDAYDVMTSERPYKLAMVTQDALAELVASAGRQFDPQVVGAFCRAALASPAEAGLEATEAPGLRS